MKRYLDQLKPQERRWVVGVGCVLFLMLNYFFVWPHFHDWGTDSARMDKATQQIAVYQAEVRHQSEYKRKLMELQSGGEQVVPEDQAIDFVHFYNSRAVNNKVIVTSQGQMVTRTNEFFLEQQVGITVQADETNLVNFLYSLGAGNSMMRVRAMSLHPDPSHMQLVANLSIVASYQKKAPAKSTNSTARAAASAPKPYTPAVHPAERPPPARAPVTTITEHTNHVAGPFGRPTSTNRPGSSNFKKP